MKKICAGIVLLALVLSLAACGGGSTAPAASAPAAAAEPSPEPTPAPTPEPTPEPTPVPAPYGIPIWDSVDNVDLDVLFDAYNRKALLQYVENFEMIEEQSVDSNFIQEGRKTYQASVDTCYFLDGDFYVYNSTSVCTNKNKDVTALRMYNNVDREQSKSIDYWMGRLWEYPVDPEDIDAILTECVLPFSTAVYRMVSP